MFFSAFRMWALNSFISCKFIKLRRIFTKNNKCKNTQLNSKRNMKQLLSIASRTRCTVLIALLISHA